jgi:hypothetical protein
VSGGGAEGGGAGQGPAGLVAGQVATVVSDGAPLSRGGQEQAWGACCADSGAALQGCSAPPAPPPERWPPRLSCIEPAMPPCSHARSYTSKVTLQCPTAVHSRVDNSTLFSHLTNKWEFRWVGCTVVVALFAVVPCLCHACGPCQLPGWQVRERRPAVGVSCLARCCPAAQDGPHPPHHLAHV